MEFLTGLTGLVKEGGHFQQGDVACEQILTRMKIWGYLGGTKCGVTGGEQGRSRELRAGEAGAPGNAVPSS